MNDIISKIIESRNTRFGEGEKDAILSLIAARNKELTVSITRDKLSNSAKWYYDEARGEIRNRDGSFFQISGLKRYENGRLILEQPVLRQDEIGYLGIICKEIGGVLKLLMQLKIEPGNINKIQLSPTIQATKSNFTQMHGGRKPAYLDYFLNADKHTILFDQIQSEQSSRFLGKRNRNIMIIVDEEVETLPTHIWLTLGQIGELMRVDNIVNMDTRTVLSCIPYSQFALSEAEKSALIGDFSDKAMFRSVFDEADRNDFIKVYRYINNYKMLYPRENAVVPLKELDEWEFTDESISYKRGWPFRVIFCDIEIEGREVRRWDQPLFEAAGAATFGLIMTELDGKKRFLVRALPEVGCFDGIELAPSVQLEADSKQENYSRIDRLFFDLLESGGNVKADVMLSEEGGRFYCEQNRNIILEVPYEALGELPQGYFLLDYRTLNSMVQYNNVLNIQLRNLLSLLEF